MRIKNVLLVAFSLLSFVTYAQDTISSIVKGKKSDIFRVATKDSVNHKRIISEYAVTRIEASKLISKKGESILPEAGDWAISIDASPFLRYMGNFIGSNGVNAAPTFNFLNGNQTIIGKYFVTPEKAYRWGLGLGFGSNSSTTKVTELPAPTPMVYVDDVTKYNNINIGLTAGMEWRKGKTRLQGYYGFEGGLTIGASGINYTYGNNLSPYNPINRTIESKEGTSYGLGVRGFMGAEYFLFPKIAIGGEFGWGIVFRTISEGSYTSEYWDSNANTVRNTITPTGGSTYYGFNAENLNSIFGSIGTIRMTLYF